LATPDEFARYQEQTQERERDGTHNHYETALLRKDGSTLNMLISGSPLTTADGSFQGTIAVIVDITERKRAVEALQEALSELEQYTYNLERQTAQLQVGAEVAREAAAILDVQQLLDTAVRLISERFGFYHAGAFLIDELREYAVLRAASSGGGQRMLARGHKLPLGKVGIVGYVAATGQSRVALDVGMDDMHFAHSDLPDTRSEMGLPLNVRGRTIGVLDVQAPEANAFTDNDVTAMQTLADQLAVAIDNARLVERTETQLRELSLLYGEYSTSAWADLTAPERSKRYVYDRIDVVPVEALESPALDMALTHGKTTTIFESGITSGVKREKTLATPLKLHDQIIGALGIQEADGGRKWSPNEIALVEAVSDQVSLALENAQHFAETQKAAQQMQVLNELARSLAIRHTTQEVLEETYMGASLLLNTLNFFIAFYQPEDKMISFPLAVENDQSVQWRPREVGNGLTEYVIRTKQPLLVRRDLPEWLEKAGIDSIGVESLCWLGAPLMVGERVLGIIAVQSEHESAYDERDRNLLTGIANQAAIALQNAYLFRETESALAETEVLYSVSETISQLEGLEKTFQSLAYILTGQLEYTGAWLAQVDKRTQTLNGIAGVGLPEDWIKTKVPLDDKLRDPSVQAVLTHSPIVINDLANDERAADMNEEARALFGRLLEVPILVGIEAGGIIAVGRSADMPEIVKRDIEVLQVVADQAAVALQNIRLLEETRRRAEQERLIYEITSKIRRSPNITTILQTAVEELGQALHADRALVRLMVKPSETKDT
jgi:GAF domain-containing protein